MAIPYATRVAHPAHLGRPTASQRSFSQAARDEKSRQQYQNWCATIYHSSDGGILDTKSDWSEYKELKFPNDVLRAQWSLERCPETGRVHIQLCFRMRSRVVFSRAKEALENIDSTAHIEACKGTWAQNLAYTRKPETHIAGPFQFPPDVPFVRVVEYWYGKPGNGKSTEARKLLKDLGYDIYEVCHADASRGTWLSDYNGEEAAIMDEVDMDWFSPSLWKKVLDTVPQTLPSKAGGGCISWTPKHIILISNYAPDDFFGSEAMRRRIDRIRFIPREPFPQKRTEMEGGALFQSHLGLDPQYRRPAKRARHS